MLSRLLILCAALAGLSTLAACDDGMARPAPAEVDARVAEATARLSESPAGRDVLASIDAHGGLAAWYAAGPLAFRYTYTRLDSLGQPDTVAGAIDTRQRIDTWAARAVHTLAADSSVQFGLDGATAWTMPGPDAVPTDARFWSLTPYYFVGIPFVLADPGVRLEPADTLTVEGELAEQVRVTFESGTGDAPDDYYYLLLDPETKRTRGVRYVVSYPAFNPDGGHTPETIMLYDGAQTVGDVTLQEGFRSFLWVDSTRAPGTPKARGTLTELRSMPELRDADFAMPAGAVPEADG